MYRGNNVAALVLAGGYSSRARAFKPMLPLGDGTIIARVIDNFRRAGVNNINVVVGHRADELKGVLSSLRVHSVYNAYYDEGMFSSVIAGLQSLRQGTEAFFLLPVDMPLVNSHTIRLLCRSFRKTGADVIYPVFRGRRGHPPLIAARCIPEILAGDRVQGLRPVLAQHEEKAREVEVLNEGILLDADTPEDYRKITDYYNNRDIPSQEECQAILHGMCVQERVVNHGKKVSEVARKLAVHLNSAGMSINVRLVATAGLLHDLAKGQPDHAGYGAKILKKLGYPQVAKIVAEHHDIEYAADFPPREAAVVYLADKLVKGDRIVTIDERFAAAMDKYAADKEVFSVVMRRRMTADNIGRTVVRIVGKDLPAIISAECVITLGRKEDQ